MPERAKRPCPVAGEIEICNHNPLMNGRSKTRETSPDRLGSPFLSRSNERPGCLGAYSGAVGGTRGFDSKDSVRPASLSAIPCSLVLGCLHHEFEFQIGTKAKMRGPKKWTSLDVLACRNVMQLWPDSAGGRSVPEADVGAAGSAINPPWTV